MSANSLLEDDFLFAGQEDEVEPEQSDKELESWRLLIVDDEPEVHKVTELALGNLEIFGRKIEFLHAYSAKEAFELLSTEASIAVILLDVVMETDDAGLVVVQRIRQELGLDEVRIILRTGQPGYAPEERVVMEYDINDYRTKTELTRNKLLTSVFSAVRSYAQLVQSNLSKSFLEALNRLNNDLISQTELRPFVDALVSHTQKLFNLSGDGLLLIDHPVEKICERDNGMWVLKGTGHYQAHIGEKYEQSLDSHVVTTIAETLSHQQHTFTDSNLAIYIPTQSCNAVLYFDINSPFPYGAELVQTFVANVASYLDNSLLLEKVRDIAYRDSLTSLPNRTRFIQMLDEYAAGALPGNTVMLVDLDHFSDVNDGLGQEIGNSLLISVAERLRQELDDSILIARSGADIFGLIGDEKTLTPERIIGLFEHPFKVEEHSIPVNATLGLCRKLDNDKSGLSVLKHTNIALNRAKKDIRARYSYYKPEMEDETSWRLGMIRRLTQDFRDDKLQLWFQPQMCVQSGHCIGMEALLRWPDGSGGFISPVVFIPLAEYSGLIVNIGEWVIEQSCRQVRQLNKLGLGQLRVAVNVSMPQFRNSDFVDRIAKTVNSYGVEPAQLELEITESVVMDDPKLVVGALERLKALGFSIAIDDFGTGFSSLSYLQQLPLDRIKVDRTFIKDIGEGGDGIIAETIIKLGRKLGLETIAEGIETQAQLDYVRALGCDESQGFFHAKPMPAAELEAFLLAESKGQ